MLLLLTHTNTHKHAHGHIHRDNVHAVFCYHKDPFDVKIEDVSNRI